MDKHSNIDTYQDPDITFDRDGHAYIHVNGVAYRYEYADESRHAPGHRRERGRPDPDSGNTDSDDYAERDE